MGSVVLKTKCASGKVRLVSYVATRDRVRKLRGEARKRYMDDLAVDHCTPEQLYQSFVRWSEVKGIKVSLTA